MRNPFTRDPDPFAASRYTNVIKSVRERQRKHLQEKWQRWVLGVVVVVAALGGAALWKIHQLQEALQEEVPVTPEQEGEPFNVLLVGSDSRGDLTPEEQLELGANAVDGARADSLVLAHVDPADDRVIMVQFPRDLYVPLADGEQRKINEALLDGRKALVTTIENLTGLEINRYVEVNIAGFRDVVDAIGGVDVCVPESIPFDSQTGLEISQPGMIHFDGDLALRYVRSRHFETGDFERIANQQKFLAAALNKVTSVGTLLRPDRVLELMDIAGKNIRIDQHTNLSRLKGILDRFRAFEPERYEAYIAPNLGTDSITLSTGEPYSIVVPDPEKMDLVFDAIRNNESPAAADGVPDIDPQDVSVGVYNGVDLTDSYAFDAANALEEASGGSEQGFAIATGHIGNAPHFNFKQTLVRYETGDEEKAELVASVIPGAVVQEHEIPDGIDVAVIVGRPDLRTTPLVQIVPLDIPQPGAQPAVCRQRGVA